MASFMTAAAHYTSIWRGDSPLLYRHNVDAPQSLSPINYYVITVPSQPVQAMQREGLWLINIVPIKQR